MAKGVYVGVDNCVPRNLPSGYTQVVWVKNTKNTNTFDYIDTGVVANKGFRFTGKIKFESIPGYGGWCGIIGSAVSIEYEYESSWTLQNALYIYRNADGDRKWGVGIDDYYYPDDNSIAVGASFDIDFSTVHSDYYFYINGVKKTLPSDLSESTSRCSLPLYFGALNCGDSGYSYAGYRTGLTTWGFKIYNDVGTLVRDYVPCKNSSGAVGLYDVVTGTFNSGKSGNFIAGPEYASLARKVRKGYVGIPVELPSGYTSLEYIESTGTQYINTNWSPAGTGSVNKGFRFVGHMLIKNTSWGSVLGFSNNWDGDYYIRNGIETNGLGFQVTFTNTNSPFSSEVSISRDIWYDFDASSIQYREYLNINNECVWRNQNPVIYPSGAAKVYLFARNRIDTGTTDYFSKIQMGKCRIYDSNDTIVRNFVPVKRNSDNAIGMFDLVTQQFFGNSGTGAFVAGPTLSSDSVARRIKKAYIGIGGVARPCWPDPEVQYYGVVPKLTYAVHWNTATNIGNYALIGCGQTNGTNTSRGTNRTNINVYNNTLVKQSDLSLTSIKDRSGNIGDYAVFVGYGGGIGGKSIEAFTSSLSKVSSVTSMGTYVTDRAVAKTGDYILFGGGYNQNVSNVSNNGVSAVLAYNKSLTKSSSSLSVSVGGQQAGATIGGYALFAGGCSGEGTASGETVRDAVYAFNSSLTRSSKTALANGGRYGMVTATIGNYAMLAGGYGPGVHSNSGGPQGLTWAQEGSTMVECYDSSLTKITSPVALSYGGTGMAATTLGGYALFAGGSGSNGLIDCYDKSLTKTSRLSLSTGKVLLAATTVGQYALFGGGHNGGTDDNSGSYSTVDAYTIIE